MCVCWYRIPVCGMQFHHSLLQLFTLIGCKNNFTDIVVLVEIWVVIAKCWLNCVWTQQSQDVRWTGQSANQNIFPQLKTQEISERITELNNYWYNSRVQCVCLVCLYLSLVVPSDVLSQNWWIRWVKLDAEKEFSYWTWNQTNREQM